MGITAGVVIAGASLALTGTKMGLDMRKASADASNAAAINAGGIAMENNESEAKALMASNTQGEKKNREAGDEMTNALLKMFALG